MARKQPETIKAAAALLQMENLEIQAHEELKASGAAWHPVVGLALPPRSRQLSCWLQL